MQELGDGAPPAADEPPLGPWERLWSAAAAPAVLSLVEALAGPAQPRCKPIANPSRKAGGLPSRRGRTVPLPLPAAAPPCLAA